MTITQSLRLRRLLSLVVPMSVIVGACAEDAEQESTTTQVSTATIANMLPVDGCSYPVTIHGVDYAPDADSTTVMRELVPAGGTLRVLIEYRLTGRTGQVECGFGATMELPEITVCLRRVLDSDATL